MYVFKGALRLTAAMKATEIGAATGFGHRQHVFDEVRGEVGVNVLGAEAARVCLHHGDAAGVIRLGRVRALDSLQAGHECLHATRVLLAFPMCRRGHHRQQQHCTYQTHRRHGSTALLQPDLHGVWSQSQSLRLLAGTPRLWHHWQDAATRFLSENSDVGAGNCDGGGNGVGRVL